jgi:hypothetical protein
MFSSGAGCKGFMPRQAEMPAPSAATAGSAYRPNPQRLLSPRTRAAISLNRAAFTSSEEQMI